MEDAQIIDLYFSRDEQAIVETDGKYVTACGMGAALEFSLELIKLLKGEEAAEHIRSAVLAK